jgi:serine/threonine protein kinase
MIGQLLTGRYLVLEKLGVGGFSETYLARDKYLPHHPLCVVKCLTVSPDSLISPETSRRLFETEAQILDRLGQQHEQIPTLFAYCHEQDQIYQVQEFVEGETLSGWLAQGQRLSMGEAIAVLLEVLPVLDYIHSHRVIHRDIKPGHLIRRQTDGKIVLIDFGAACFLEADFNVKQDHEEAALAIGTPGYMPNEQLDGTSQFNSDLYALGMTVIHLMTGMRPQEFQHDSISGELDWQFFLSEPGDPKFLAILSRMVQSNPRDRYQRAVDVLKALESVPIVREYVARTRKTLTRKQVMQRVLKTAAAIAVTTGLIGGWYAYGERAGAKLAQLGTLFHHSDVHLTLLRDLPMQAPIERMLIAPNNQMLVTAGSDHVLRLWSLPDGSSLKSLSGHTEQVTTLAMSQDSHLLVSGSADRVVRLWDISLGKALQEFKGHQQAVTAVAISPDAQTVVSGSKDGTLRLWDAQTGILLQTFKLPKVEVTAVAYGMTPDTLISASSDRQLQVWDLRTGKLRRTFVGHTDPIVGLQAVDDQMVMSFSRDRALVWNLQREELVRVFSGNSATPVAALLNNRQMVRVDDNGSVQVWTRNTGWQETTILNQWRNLAAALSSDYRYLACWSSDRRLRIWQMSNIQ